LYDPSLTILSHFLFQARRESEKNASVVDEVMQAAASEVSSLEAKVDELESQLSSERKKNERGLDRKKWKNETNSLLSSIQQECNSIFRNKMMPVQSSPSPRTVVDEDDDNEVDLSVVALDQTQDHVLRTMVDWSPVTSAAAVDVDQTLDETEAIVRSLMEGA
jgi:phenylalanyl-tRNA synthetase alpha subunit